MSRESHYQQIGPCACGRSDSGSNRNVICAERAARDHGVYRAGKDDGKRWGQS